MTKTQQTVELMKRPGGVTLYELADFYNCEIRHIYGHVSNVAKLHPVKSTVEHGDRVYKIVV